LLDRVLANAAREGITEVLIGSMHRGRLNLMANILDMPLAELLSLIIGSHPFATEPTGLRPTFPIISA